MVRQPPLTPAKGAPSCHLSLPLWPVPPPISRQPLWHTELCLHLLSLAVPCPFPSLALPQLSTGCSGVGHLDPSSLMSPWSPFSPPLLFPHRVYGFSSHPHANPPLLSTIIYIATEPLRARRLPGPLWHASAMKRSFSLQAARSPGLLHLSRAASPPPAWPCTPRCFQMSSFNVLLRHLSQALEEELSWRADKCFSSFPALSLRRCRCLSHSPASAFPIFMLL